MEQLQTKTKLLVTTIDGKPPEPGLQRKSTPFLIPGNITAALCVTALALLVPHILISAMQYNNWGSATAVEKLNRFFNFNEEGNLPTFFSSILLLMASALLFVIRQLSAQKKCRQKWLLLSVLFLFLAADEACQIHERINTVARGYLPNDFSGFLYWAWVLPYSFLILGVGIYIFRFVLSLPRRTRNLFILSAIVFVSGALVIESVEGHLNKLYSYEHVIFFFTTTIQELMEMAGVIIFIHALSEYISGQVNFIRH